MPHNILNVFITGISYLLLLQGGYYSGDSNDVAIDALVEKSKGKVVVVSINYRLGVFGFLASTKIMERSLDNSGIF